MTSWAEDDKPREKMMHKGVSTLSVSELLAVLIRSGSDRETAFDLARRILADCDNDLDHLARWGVKELMNRYRGIGAAKAASLVAAFELSRRRMLHVGEEAPKLSCSKDIFQFMQPRIGDLEHEEFWVIQLNNACRVKGCERLFSGGMEGTMVDLRILFRKVLEAKARSLVVAHNHPSGILRPSSKDIALTDRIKAAGQTLDVLLLDHLVICSTGYYSFADNGLL